MVTASDILFWTGYTVTEEDATRYTNAAETHLDADGGADLAGETRTEALCYFIASRISNKEDSGIISESVGGYSYSKKTSASSSYWLDLYRELLPTAVVGSSPIPGGNKAVRIDTHLFKLNRRYHG